MARKKAAPPPDEINPMRATLRGFAVGAPIFIVIAVALLYGLSYLNWRNSDPATALTELSHPPQAEIVARFGPVNQLPVPVGGVGEVISAEGLLLRTGSNTEAIVGQYTQQYEEKRWVLSEGNPARADLPNRLTVLVEPINAETAAALLGEEITLSEGENLLIVLAWKSDFWD